MRAGALTLWRAAPWLAPGVILAVVDPGVGHRARAVAVEVAGAGAVLVGPDNGLLLPAAASLGPLTAAVAPGRPPPTARARPSPAATSSPRPPPNWPLGADSAAWGRRSTRTAWPGRPVPEPQAGPDGSLRAEVLWVDHFGNAQLNVRPADADHLGRVVDLRCRAHTGPARVVGAYGDLDPGEVGLVTDSYGLLAVSCRGAPAAARLGLTARRRGAGSSRPRA